MRTRFAALLLVSGCLNWDGLPGLYGSNVPVLDGLDSLEVSPVAPVVSIGSTQQFTAIGKFGSGMRDVTNEVVWSAADPTIAVVNSSGLATSIKGGTVTIFATNGTVVGQAVLRVTGATLNDVSISPSPAAMAVGTTLRFAATGTFSDGTKIDLTPSSTWVSSNTSVATISAGVASGLAAGMTTISLAGTSATVMLEVKWGNFISIDVCKPYYGSCGDPPSTQIAKNTMIPLVAFGRLADGTKQDLTSQVTWEAPSGTFSAALLDGYLMEERFTAGGPGNITISARFNGVVGSANVTVNDVTLTTIGPVNFFGSCTFFALGQFSDGSNQDLTRQAAWSSADTSAIQFDSTLGKEGQAVGNGQMTTVTVSLFGVMGSDMLSCM